MELIKEIFDGKVRIYQLDFKIKNIKGPASTIYIQIFKTNLDEEE